MVFELPLLELPVVWSNMQIALLSFYVIKYLTTKTFWSGRAEDAIANRPSDTAIS